MSASEHAAAIRRAYPSVLGKVLKHTRSLPDAEDAVHDAIERALSSWGETGTPDSVEAWLIAVATNSHRDEMRRARRAENQKGTLETLARLSPWAQVAVAEPDILRGWKDELLSLLFACCHPVLEDGESAALALSTVVGLSINELAQAFLVAPRSMEQRLARARLRLREKGDIDGTTPDRGRDRIGGVLRTLYLLFNEGYWSTKDAAPVRADLCRLALGLARSLFETYPGEPEVAGLLALLLLHEARREARLDAHGSPVPLPKQDRSRWDHDAIRSATDLLERTLGASTPGPLQTEAAIAAVHCNARSADATDWSEIASLYAILEQLRPTPAVRTNRAFAVGKARGAREGIALLDNREIDASSYPYMHIVRASLLEEAGETAAAMSALERAKDLARNVHERTQIQDWLCRLSTIKDPQ